MTIKGPLLPTNLASLQRAMDSQDATSAQSSASLRELDTSMTLCRRMARAVETYPWETNFILGQNDLDTGWIHHTPDLQPRPCIALMRIANKVAAYEQQIFKGRHSTEVMATRGYLRYDLYGRTSTVSSLAGLAASAAEQMTNNTHSNGPRRGRSLLTSYRFLDRFASILMCHPGVWRRPAAKPLCSSQVTTALLQKFSHILSDIPALLLNFRAAWQRHTAEEVRCEGRDYLKGYIQTVLDMGTKSHAGRVERNMLASSLPLIVLARNDTLQEGGEAEEPAAPELLEGLYDYIEAHYLDKDDLSETQKKNVRQAFSPKSVAQMRKAHVISVHVTPLLNLVNITLQRCDEISEEDIIETARILGTHDIPLLSTIENWVWDAIWSISVGHPPSKAIQKLFESLPWDEIESVTPDHPINTRFMPNTGLSQSIPNVEPDQDAASQGQNGASRRAAVQDQSDTSQRAAVQDRREASLDQSKSTQGAAGQDQNEPSQDQDQDQSNQGAGGGSQDSSPKSTASELEKPALKRKRRIVKVADIPPPAILLSSTEQSCANIKALDPLKKPASHVAVEMDLHSTSGRIYPVKLQLPRNSIARLQKLAETSYYEGRPAYISAPDKSSILVLSADSLQIMTASEVQELICRRHIIESDRPIGAALFDLAALSTVAPLSKSVLVRDEAARIYAYNLSDLYSLHGRAVGTLEVATQSYTTEGVLSFATDRRAYEYRMYCPEKDHTGQDRPMPVLQWSFVALKGAVCPLRISPEGAGTWIECDAGRIWYYLLRPKGSSLDYRKFGGITNNVFAEYEVEAFLLQPGTRAYIRPFTPFCYVAAEHSICRGGYFYSLSTMADTFFALVHNLAGTSSIPLADGSATVPTLHFGHLIRLIVQYAHRSLVAGDDMQLPQFRHAMKPDGLTTETMHGFFAIISIGILCNALDPASYMPNNAQNHREEISDARMEQYDYNAMQHDERAGCIMTRGFALDLRDWFCHYYQIDGHPWNTTRALTAQIIAAHACALFKAELAAEDGDPSPVKYQLLQTFAPGSDERMALASMIAEAEQGNSLPYMYYDLVGCTLAKTNNPTLYQSRTMDEIQALGTCLLDEKYLDGLAQGFGVDATTKKRRL